MFIVLIASIGSIYYTWEIIEIPKDHFRFRKRGEMERRSGQNARCVGGSIHIARIWIDKIGCFRLMVELGSQFESSICYYYENDKIRECFFSKTIC